MLLLFVLAFCNVPGQLVATVKYSFADGDVIAKQYEHGWPLTYLVRNTTAPRRPTPEGTVRDCFDLGRGGEEFRAFSLLANGCIVLAISLATSCLFETWRRRRTRLWQFHLRDLFALVVLVSVLAVWSDFIQRRSDRERAVVGPGRSIDSFCDQEGGITWVRRWTNLKLFWNLNRPFHASIESSRGWPQLSELDSVRVLDVNVHATTAELSHLANLEQLEVLSLVGLPDGMTSDLPRLPKLRRLGMGKGYTGLDQLTSLESLSTDGNCLTPPVFRELRQLPNLREMSIRVRGSHDLSDLCSLEHLSGLRFSGDIHESTLQSIGMCRDLKHLSFHMCNMEGSGMHHLRNLANLETLDLSYANISGKDLRGMEHLKRLRELDLSCADVGGALGFLPELENLEKLTLFATGATSRDLQGLVGLKNLHWLDLGFIRLDADGVACLYQMKQLKYLRITRNDVVDINRILKSLPECETYRTTLDF